VKVAWHPVADVRAFLSQRGTFTTKPHEFTKRILHWPYCARCGLVALRNAPTRKLMAKLCTVEE
jgi:hypothetical protein